MDNSIFDHVFALANSFNHMIMLIMGLPFFGIGLAFISFWGYWRLFTDKFEGRIHGVQVNRKIKPSYISDEDNEPDFDFGFDPMDQSDVQSSAYQTVQRRSHMFGRTPGRSEISSDRSANLQYRSARGDKVWKGRWFFAAFIMIFFVVGVSFAYRYADLKMNGVQTLATIVDYETSYDSESGYSYYAVVEYRDISGRWHRVEDNIDWGTDIKSLINTKTPIYYDPQKPEKFIIDDFWHNMLLPAVFIGVSTIFLLVIFSAKPAMRSGGLKHKKATKNNYDTGKYSGEMYYPVYEYVGAAGQVMKAYSYLASNNITNKIPGTAVNLFIRASSPGTAMPAGYFSLIFGLLFFIPGLIMLYFGFASIQFDFYSLIIFTFVLAIIFIRVGKQSKKMKVKSSAKKTFSAHHERQQRKREARPFLSHFEIRERLEEANKLQKNSAIIFAIIAVGLIIGGAYWTNYQKGFEGYSYTAQGEVTQVARKSSSGGSNSTYVSEVTFVSDQGIKYVFRDKISSSIKLHNVGDKVEVLYNPGKPYSAIIDRGIFNFVPQAFMILTGCLILFSTLLRLFSLRKRPVYYKR